MILKPSEQVPLSAGRIAELLRYCRAFYPRWDDAYADQLRQTCLDKFNVSLGGGLGSLKGRLFRIGHLGDVNETMVLGALAAVEISLELADVPHGRGGVQAAMEYLASEV